MVIYCVEVVDVIVDWVEQVFWLTGLLQRWWYVVVNSLMVGTSIGVLSRGIQIFVVGALSLKSVDSVVR